MTITVKLGDAKTELSELLPLVEAGQEVVIARGETPVARLSPIAATPPYTQRLDTGERAAQPSTSVESLSAAATSRQVAKWLASQSAQVGGSMVNVALPVVSPSA